MYVKCRNLSFMVVPFISLDEYGAVQVVLVDFVDEDALGIAAQEEEGDGAKPDFLGEELAGVFVECTAGQCGLRLVQPHAAIVLVFLLVGYLDDRLYFAFASGVVLQELGGAAHHERVLEQFLREPRHVAIPLPAYLGKRHFVEAIASQSFKQGQEQDGNDPRIGETLLQYGHTLFEVSCKFTHNG